MKASFGLPAAIASNADTVSTDKAFIDKVLSDLQQLSQSKGSEAAASHLLLVYDSLRRAKPKEIWVQLFERFSIEFESDILNCEPCTQAFLQARIGSLVRYPYLKVAHYQKAFSLTEKFDCQFKYKSYPAFLTNYGNHLVGLGDYEAGKKILRKVIELSKDQPNLLARAHIELSNCFIADSLAKSRLHLEKALYANSEKHNLTAVYGIVGYFLEPNALDVDSARFWFDFADRYRGNAVSQNLQTQFYEIEYLLHSEEGNKRLALERFKAMDPEQTWTTWNIPLDISKLYAHLNQTDSAISLLHDALDFASGGNWDSDELAFSVKYTPSKTAELVYLVELAQLYRTNDSKKALACYDQSFEILDNLRLNHTLASSVRSRSERLKVLFKEAIDLSWDVSKFSTGQEEIYFKKIFTQIEKSKAFDLKIEKLKSEGAHSTRLKLNLEKIQLLEYYFKDTSINDTLKREIRIKLDSLKNLQQQNTSKVLFSVDRLMQDLHNSKSLLVEYFCFADSAYCVTLDQSISVEKLKIDSALVNSLKEIALDYHPEPNWESNFTETSERLYKALHLPQSDNAGTKLIVVADEILYGLPFELLLNRKDGDANWQSMLLLNELSIYYSYSAALLNFESDDLLAHYTTFTPWVSEQPKGYPSLHNSLSELKFSKNLFPTAKTVVDEHATLANLEQSLAESDILHIVSHGNSENGTPYIIIRDSSAHNAYKVFGRDIKKLPKSPSLIVLNACLSGKGNISSSEGLEHLGYDFIFAGSKSALVANNYLPNGIAGQILNHTFSEWKSGMDLPDALRMAKLKYLNEQDDPVLRHPAYWSGLMMYGQANPGTIPSEKNSSWTFLLFVLALPIVYILTSRLFKK